MRSLAHAGKKARFGTKNIIILHLLWVFRWDSFNEKCDFHEFWMEGLKFQNHNFVERRCGTRLPALILLWNLGILCTDSFVTLKSYHTRSTKRPIAPLPGFVDQKGNPAWRKVAAIKPDAGEGADIPRYLRARRNGFFTGLVSPSAFGIRLKSFEPLYTDIKKYNGE